MTLWRPEAFEPLTAEPWDEGRVREGIRAIVADAEGAFDADALWPADEWDGWHMPLPLKQLYVGASGVIWALDALRRRGYADVRIDLPGAALRTLELWREEPDFISGYELPELKESSLLCGETGVLVVAWRLAPSAELADDLYKRVTANVDNDAIELMWGSPGTMLAARAMHEWTGEQRWADAWRESADVLLRRRDDDGLWTKKLYGEESRGLGPPHGVVGNVLALLRGGPNEQLTRETAAVLARTAVVEDGLANWPNRAGEDLVGRDGEIRVQWCTGAPGIVISAPYLDEELMLAGAELAWRAGPHGMEKGPCICHGTAGNGYAFLKVFERSGDERWLERARRFAVHALEQVERRRTAQGHGRFSLWTGDVGVALYAADCLEGRASYPVVDGL
jgi:Lanthionine synthetase C-like protein